MNRLVVLLTGVQVLVHSLFGCCAHAEHQHAQPAAHVCCHHGDCAEPVAAGHAHAGPHGDSTAHSTACTPDSDSQPVHQCAHDACQWVYQREASSASPIEQLAACFLLPCIANQHCCLSAEGVGLQAGAASDPAPPVRLHLRLGVLLI